MERIVIFWFRRDLRLEDNAALHHALKSGFPVLPVFIFDTHILDELEDRRDHRVIFIYRTVSALKKMFEEEYGSTLQVYQGTPLEVFGKLLDSHAIEAVYANEDYEPYATERDSEIADLLARSSAVLRLYKDQVMFAKDDVVKDNGEPYVVFTPYSRQWLSQLDTGRLQEFSVRQYAGHFIKCQPATLPALDDIGFQDDRDFDFPATHVPDALMRAYADKRNFPAQDATSRIGVHLRFGTVSVRRLVRKARAISDTFLNELIWREFFMQILWHYPRVVEESFRAQYDHIHWRNDRDEFRVWCEGRTGFPMVDAGMRELNATGFMHNRVRMVVASFLTKHLLIDWRWGEAYFAEKLLDYELASNNGNWQWAAGTGCDAAPYFRIFNPAEQLRKFDPDGKYVRKWVPELNTDRYPEPVVDHKEARKRALAVYGDAVKSMQ